MIEIELPWPPSVNHYKQVGRVKQTKWGNLFQSRINSEKTKAYFWEVCIMIRQKGLKSFDSATISVEVDAHPPNKRKFDLDNILKVLIDAMQKGGLYTDDCQIARLLVTRRDIITPNGKVIVRIRKL